MDWRILYVDNRQGDSHFRLNSTPPIYVLKFRILFVVYEFLKYTCICNSDLLFTTDKTKFTFHYK